MNRNDLKKLEKIKQREMKDSKNYGWTLRIEELIDKIARELGGEEDENNKTTKREKIF